MRTAIILVGGKGSRMDFTEKALLELRGKPIIEHIIENLKSTVDEFIIAARDEEQGSKLKLDNVIMVYDSIKNFGPIAGIYAGLKASTSEYSFVTACDMPCINRKVVELLFTRAKGYDAAIPFPPEPLHAVYKKGSTLNAAKNAIERRKGAIMYIVDRLNVNFVPKQDIREIDPQLSTFININRPEDIEPILKSPDSFCEKF
jgi:molybdopterin-guanine dinucleotide biosynthesis protein A